MTFFFHWYQGLSKKKKKEKYVLFMFNSFGSFEGDSSFEQREANI